MDEWATTTEIAQMLGKTMRRIQQLTQEGVLKTEVPPWGGKRMYRTCETLQRYRDTAEKANAQHIGDAKKLLAILDTLPQEKRWIVQLVMDAFISGMAAQESINTTGREINNA